MAEGEKNKKPQEPLEERFKYIGFDVFPGKAGDMFKSDEERKSWVEKVKDKLARSHGEVRDRCTLIETRVSSVERIFLTLAAVAMIAALFIPWFSGYIPVSYAELGSFGDHTFFYASTDDEVGIKDVAQALRAKHERRSPGSQTVAAPPREVMGDEGVEGGVAEGGQEGASPQIPAEAEISEQPPAEINVIFISTPQIEQVHGLNDLRKYVVASFSFNTVNGRERLIYGVDNVFSVLPEELAQRARHNDSVSTAVTDSLRQEALKRIAAGDSTIAVDSIFFAGPILVENKPVTEMAFKGIVNDSYSITGLGALASIGSYASMIFSSGVVLVITGILLIAYFLSCLVMAILNLYLLYGAKKKDSEEQNAIYMKRMLRYNWIPVYIWLVMFILSFVGSSYGFDSRGMLKQVGDTYDIATFIGLSSFGIYITLAAFLIAALKGKEI